MSAPGVLEQDLVAAYLMARLMAVAPTTWATLGIGNPARIGEVPAPPEFADAGSYLGFNLQTPQVADVTPANATLRVMADSLWLVKGVVKGESFIPARKLARQADLTLANTSGPVTLDDYTGTIMACVRVGTVRYPETDADGAAWRHVGCLYRVQVQ